jgi:hypothetical protein
LRLARGKFALDQCGGALLLCFGVPISVFPMPLGRRSILVAHLGAQIGELGTLGRRQRRGFGCIAHRLTGCSRRMTAFAASTLR